MKNKLTIIFLSSLLAVPAILGLTSKVNKVNEVKVEAAVGNYYSSIGTYDTGDTLLGKLRTLNASKRTRLINYNDLWDYFSQTDPYGSSGVRSFYTGEYCGRSYTREHIWPFSRLYLNNVTGNERGDNDIEKDLYEIRPCSSSINEGRNNKFYGYEGEYTYDPGQYEETYRGDAARIIFYCVVADDNLKLVDKDTDAVMNRSMGKLSTLLEWNLQYAVTSRENTRNDAVQSIQGHRNPFVDHPEYACRIWGNTNTATKKICAHHGFEKELSVKWDSLAVNSISVPKNGHRDLNLYLNNSKVNSNISLSFIEPTYGYEITSDIADLEVDGNVAIIKGKKNGTGILKCTTTYSLSQGGSETISKYIDVTVESKTNLSSIEITDNVKKTYNVGETFDPTGLVVTAVYSNGMRQDVTKYVTFENNVFTTAKKRHFVYITYEEASLTLTDSIIVSVTDGSEPTGGTSKGCGGNIATTSITLGVISLSGIIILSLASIRRKKER